jgi:hypothetical protein
LWKDLFGPEEESEDTPPPEDEPTPIVSASESNAKGRFNKSAEALAPDPLDVARVGRRSTDRGRYSITLSI